MKLPSRVSRRDAGMTVLAVLTTALFLVCAYFAASNFCRAQSDGGSAPFDEDAVSRYSAGQ